MVTLPGGGTVTYAYDDAGRTVRMLDGTGTTTYSYDDLNRLTGTTHAGTSVGYAWDDVSRLTALTSPSGDVVTRTYDDAGQLATVTDWADREFAFDWTDDGQLDEVSYPNGVVTSYERDVAGQVTGLTAASQAGQDLLELAYGYSDAGLMTDRTTTRGTQADSAQFGWDALARVDAVTGTGAGDVGFDAAGSVTVLPDGRQLTYDVGRQLTTLTVPGADDAVVTTGFTYDARGNRLTATTDTGPDAGTVTHTYDLANRLTSITGVDEGLTTYAYDGNGLRASATTGSTTESFTWDLAAAYPLLLTDAEYAFVYGTAGVPLAQIGLDDDGEVDYLHTDSLGSVAATTSGAAAVNAETDYDEYGLPRSVGGADPVSDVTRFGYAGEYTDASGYLYLRARYYDPTTTQFLTVDPLIDTTGNPYGYTDGNPLQSVDPLGLVSKFGVDLPPSPPGGCAGYPASCGGQPAGTSTCSGYPAACNPATSDPFCSYEQGGTWQDVGPALRDAGAFASVSVSACFGVCVSGALIFDGEWHGQLGIGWGVDIGVSGSVGGGESTGDGIGTSQRCEVVTGTGPYLEGSLGEPGPDFFGGSGGVSFGAQAGCHGMVTYTW